MRKDVGRNYKVKTGKKCPDEHEEVTRRPTHTGNKQQCPFGTATVPLPRYAHSPINSCSNSCKKANSAVN